MAGKRKRDAQPGSGISQGTAKLDAPRVPPIVRRLVVIRCKASKRVAAAPVFDREKLRSTGTDLETYEVETAEQARRAFGSLRDGDILVLNAHANQDLLAYRDAPHSEARVSWPDIWNHFGVRPPPRLAATVLASCTVPKRTLTRRKLRSVRTALSSSMLVAPFATAKYAVSPFGDNDHLIARDMSMAIARFYAGQLSKTALTEALFVDQTRFGVVYGCNGYNHPLGCGCGFGMPHPAGKRR